MKTIRERIIKHYITSIFGLLIMIIAAGLWILGKIDAWGLIPAGLFGVALFWSRDKWIERMISGVFNRGSGSTMGEDQEIDQSYSKANQDE